MCTLVNAAYSRSPAQLVPLARAAFGRSSQRSLPLHSAGRTAAHERSPPCPQSFPEHTAHSRACASASLAAARQPTRRPQRAGARTAPAPRGPAGLQRPRRQTSAGRRRTRTRRRRADLTARRRRESLRRARARGARQDAAARSARPAQGWLLAPHSIGRGQRAAGRGRRTRGAGWCGCVGAGRGGVESEGGGGGAFEHGGLPRAAGHHGDLPCRSYRREGQGDARGRRLGRVEDRRDECRPLLQQCVPGEERRGVAVLPRPA